MDQDDSLSVSSGLSRTRVAQHIRSSLPLLNQNSHVGKLKAAESDYQAKKSSLITVVLARKARHLLLLALRAKLVRRGRLRE
jgi:hypothetical protein